MRPYNNQENMTLSENIFKSSASTYESSGSPLEYNQDQTPLMNQGSL